jgi:hypothetical protein
MENMKKNCPEKFSPEKVYHIYLKDRCVMHSLSEEEFDEKWLTMNSMVKVMSTTYNLDDLSFEVVEKPPIGYDEASY